MKIGILLLLICVISCTSVQKTTIPAWTPYDETEELAKNAKNESTRLRYKLIQSKILDKNELWKKVSAQMKGFTEQDYETLKPLILEQDIPTLQSHIKSGKLSYEKLTQWYLFRIVKFENDKTTALNNIIAINPKAVAEARKKDKNKSDADHPIYGMPILLKDNINTEGMATTAGAHIFLENKTGNAFIADRLQEKGAIILGKANLSEWANYLCLECPNGYSAVGGQTLNPYGRKIFDTGGSSAGSGSTMAANYAVAAVGTETSGSILSPSSSNSIVGLKPTTGLLSRGGIVPISGTFDTPGPMTRNITDNAILLSAMAGEDKADLATKDNPKNKNYQDIFKTGNLKGMRFGIYKSYLRDSLYKLNVEKISSLGGIVIEMEPEQMNTEGFGTILNADMKTDLPAYIKEYGSAALKYRSVSEIMEYNKKDSLVSIPYGQGRFEGIVKTNMTAEDLTALKLKVRKSGISYFEKPIEQYQLDVIVSIANRNAGQAASANYPCLTVPMGYRKSGEPVGITFIARPFQEDKLLQVGYAFEQATRLRKIPEAYQ
ncbi:MAG: amidase [Gloeobacteraceae cyanobacterium ES-bin-316]|nr:amidase [Ferruginibacter sp.]